MANILVIYGTQDGQTALISHRIAEFLRKRGHQVDVRNAEALLSSFSPRVFDGILLGAAVHWGRCSDAVRDFVRENAAILGRKPTWFFSVSLAAADGEHGKEHAARYVEELCGGTGWTPERAEVFADRLAYTQYGAIKKLMMKGVASAAHLDTDTSRDHEYTDWHAVWAFAGEFDERLRPAVDEAAERSEMEPLLPEEAPPEGSAVGDEPIPDTEEMDSEAATVTHRAL